MPVRRCKQNPGVKSRVMDGEGGRANAIRIGNCLDDAPVIRQVAHRPRPFGILQHQTGTSRILATLPKWTTTCTAACVAALSYPR